MSAPSITFSTPTRSTSLAREPWPSERTPAQPASSPLTPLRLHALARIGVLPPGVLLLEVPIRCPRNPPRPSSWDSDLRVPPFRPERRLRKRPTPSVGGQRRGPAHLGQTAIDRSSSSALLGQVTDGSGWWPETEYRSATRAIYPALLGTGRAPVNRGADRSSTARGPNGGCGAMTAPRPSSWDSDLRVPPSAQNAELRKGRSALANGRRSEPTNLGQPGLDRSSSSALLGSGWWPETEYRSTTRAIS